MLNNMSISNHIDLFDRYIDGELSPSELTDFNNRLKSDPAFAADFEIYAFAILGLEKEENERDMEFGIAMEHIDKSELQRIIGAEDKSQIKGAVCFSKEPLEERMEQTSQKRNIRRINKMTNERWISIAAMFAVVVMAGLFIGYWRYSYNSLSSTNAQIDNIIVAYNDFPMSDRGTETEIGTSISALKEAYADAPADDSQTREEIGLRLAMAYLKEHDRKNAETLLTEMAQQFASADPDFAARCSLILSQLK